MMMPIAVRSAVFLVMFLAACGGPSPPMLLATMPRPSPTLPAPTMLPIPQSDALSSGAPSLSAAPPPASCTKAAINQGIQRFIVAFNQGDQAQLARSFGPRFEGYSVHEGDPQHGGRTFIAYGPSARGSIAPNDNLTAVPREGLLPLLAARHAHGERLTLQVADGSYESARNIFNFGLRLVRTADDIAPGLGGPDHAAGAKGSIDCTDQTIILWGMWQDKADPGAP